jgi:hypothetical protein
MRGIYATVEAMLEEKSYDAISVSLPEARGHIHDLAIYQKSTATTYNIILGGKFVGSLPLKIPYGDYVFIFARAINDSEVAQTLTLTVEFISPTGAAVGTNSVSGSVNPGSDFAVYSSYVQLNQAGTWKVHVKLEG